MFCVSVFAQDSVIFEDTITFSLRYDYLENKYPGFHIQPWDDFLNDIEKIKDSTAVDTVVVGFSQIIRGHIKPGRTIERPKHIWENFPRYDDRTKLELTGQTGSGFNGLSITIWGNIYDKHGWATKIWSNNRSVLSWDEVKVGYESRFSQYIYYGADGNNIDRDDLAYLAQGVISILEVKEYDREEYYKTTQKYIDSVKAYEDSVQAYVDSAKAYEDSVRAYVDSVRAYVDSIKAYQDSLKTFIITPLKVDSYFDEKLYIDVLGRRFYTHKKKFILYLK